MDDLIQQIAQERLGAAPGGAPPGAAPAGAAPPQAPPGAGQPGPTAAPQPPQAPPAPPPPNPETPIEKAADAAAVTNPADEEAIALIKVGQRNFTGDQLTGLLDRYAETNDRLDNYSPVMELVDQLMQAAEKGGAKGTIKDAADFLRQSVQAYIGGSGKEGKPSSEGARPTGEQKPTQAADVSAQLKQWAEKNGIDGDIPGLAETLSGVGELKQQMATIVQLLQGNHAGQNAMQGAQALAQNAVNDKMAAYKERVGVNVQAALQAVGKGADSAADFFMFAASRGYTPEDLLNRQFAMRLAKDYEAIGSSDESKKMIERLKRSMGRREAVAGATEGAPAAPASGQKPAAGDPMFDSILAAHLPR